MGALQSTTTRDEKEKGNRGLGQKKRKKGRASSLLGERGTRGLGKILKHFLFSSHLC